RGDFQAAAPSAACHAGGGMQDAVAQGLGLGLGEVAVESEQPQPGQQGGGDQRGGQPGLVEGEQVGGELADPGVFAGADAVFDPGMDSVGGIDVGGAGPPAAQAVRQVGDP